MEFVISMSIMLFQQSAVSLSILIIDVLMNTTFTMKIQMITARVGRHR